MEHRFDLKGKGLLLLLVFWFFWFTNMTVRLSFAPILPLIEDEFLVTHAKASSVFTFMSLGYALSMFVSGFYAGRFGYKKSVALSLAATSLLLFLIPFVKAFSLLYVFNFIMGASIGAYLPAVLPLITEYFTEHHWARAIAIHDSGAPVGIFCCPLIALFLLQFFGWRGTFQVLAVVLLVNAVLCWFMGYEVKVIRSEKNAFDHLLKARSLWIMNILFVLGTGANLGIFGIMPLYLTKELSFGIGYANHLVSLSRLGGIVTAVSVTFFVHRIDPIKALFFVLLLTGILTILMGAAPAGHTGMVLFFQVVVVTAFFPLAFVAAAKIFTRDTRSLATGVIVAFGILFGGGAVPYLLGLSGDLVSFRLGISILGLLICLLSPLTLVLKEYRQPKEPPSPIVG
jgi:NNP family nitrate/nitrite transporter-like MFS transporter